jgi:hypothetical protein
MFGIWNSLPAVNEATLQSGLLSLRKSRLPERASMMLLGVIWA